MIKGQDIVLLLHLVGEPEIPSTQALADRLGLSAATTHRAIHSLQQAGLFDRARGRVPVASAEEFLVHGVKFVFPAARGGEARGVLAAWAAPPLDAEVSDGGLPPVWPHAEGRSRGITLEPLHPTVPVLALESPPMWRRLALVDAIRAGDARIRRLAERALVEDLRAAADR